MTTASRPKSFDVPRGAAGVMECLEHPLRLCLLEIMERGGEHSGSELQAFSGATHDAVSEQLGILRGHGVVGARHDGIFLRYRITERSVFHILANVHEHNTLSDRTDVAPEGLAWSA